MFEKRETDNKYIKQIILINSQNEPVRDEFAENGFHVTVCPFEITRIMEVRDISDVIFLNITEEDSDLLKRIALYLRDLCIEEEKILYIYGKHKGVEIIRSMIPSIFIRKAGYVYSVALGEILKDLKELTAFSNKDVPGLLIVDDDPEYVERLRMSLEHSFRIYVSHRDLIEAGMFLKVSDVVLISVEADYTLIDFLEFFRAVYARKKAAGLKLYYLASDNGIRDRLNLGSENDAMAISKSADISCTVSFLTGIVSE